MRERTIKYDVDSGFIFDENGIQLSGAQLPSLTFRDQLQINLQLIKDGENYTGLAGAGNIGVSAAVDNEYSHYDPAALVGALTAGATITSLRLSGVDITPARAENITLINAANESETIPYEGYAATATAGTFDFTIDSHELAYSYANGAEARLGEPLIIKAATGDTTDIATGLVKFVLDGDTSNFQDAVEGSANIPGALCQVYFVDESDDVLFTATFQINLYGRIDDSGAVPPPTDPAYSWSKAAADARFAPASHVGAGGDTQHPDASISGSGFMPALSGDALDFLNGSGEWAEPMNPITEALTIYVATTGSDTIGDGSVGAPYATINKALACLAKRWIGADVIISVAGGQYTLTENLIVNHPQSRRIRIQGATPITSALSGNIGTVTGGSGAWSITVNVADATGITTGMYALFYNLAGGTNPTTLYGCHEITGVSGNAITIASKAITADAPSGAVTGTFIALPTIISGTGTLLDIVSGLRALRQICFVNDGSATTNFCVQVRPSEALLNIGYLGIANSYIGILVDMRAAMVHPLTESPAGQVNAISGCTHGLYVSGGGASGQQFHITGCGTGLVAVNGGSITEAASKIIHNTTASSPAINTNGNNNSYITYS